MVKGGIIIPTLWTCQRLSPDTSSRRKRRQASRRVTRRTKKLRWRRSPSAVGAGASRETGTPSLPLPDELADPLHLPPPDRQMHATHPFSLPRQRLARACSPRRRGRCGSTSLQVSPEYLQSLDYFIDVFRLHESLVLIIGDDKNSIKTRLANNDILTNTNGTIRIVGHLCPRSYAAVGLRSLPSMRSLVMSGKYPYPFRVSLHRRSERRTCLAQS